MNHELLNTAIVKDSILIWIAKGFTVDEIKNKLEDIHLIIIDYNTLNKFIKKLLQENDTKSI